TVRRAAALRLFEARERAREFRLADRHVGAPALQDRSRVDGELTRLLLPRRLDLSGDALVARGRQGPEDARAEIVHERFERRLVAVAGGLQLVERGRESRRAGREVRGALRDAEELARCLLRRELQLGRLALLLGRRFSGDQYRAGEDASGDHRRESRFRCRHVSFPSPRRARSAELVSMNPARRPDAAGRDRVVSAHCAASATPRNWVPVGAVVTTLAVGDAEPSSITSARWFAVASFVVAAR